MEWHKKELAETFNKEDIRGNLSDAVKGADVFIGVSHLFRRPECISRNLDVHFTLSPLFLASFISYIESYPDLCRNDLSIKKKDIERLGKIFPKKEKCLSLILNALINLGIARLGEKELSVDEKRLAKFASLPECRQYAYLSVASAAHFGRESLRSQAQLLLDIAATVPPEGFSRSLLKILSQAFPIAV